MKKSAGILVYQKKEDFLVFLGHMGGPFFKNKKNSWTMIKGEQEEETAIAAAIREFKEETGFVLKAEDLTYFTCEKVSSNKWLTVYLASVSLDINQFQGSNLVKMEWPLHSKKIQIFPEIDQVNWFTIDQAKEVIVKGQLPILEKIVDKLGDC